MARAQSAFVSRKDVPARGDLQRALDALKLKVALDDTYVPFKSSGYLPCTIDGEDAGFDIKFQDLDPSVTRPDDVQACLRDKDVEIAFRWAGDPREAACALAVGAALARDFGAIVVGEGGSSPYSTEALIAKARDAAGSL